MKKAVAVILGILVFTSLKCSVSAENITYQRLNDIYYNLTVDGNTTSNHVTKFFLDGRLAYCIDPGAPINTSIYNSSSEWNINSLTNEQQQQIEKLGYYGYEYPNHQTDRYYIATQELIWQVIKPVNIRWTNSAGNTIDVSKEKQEIESLVQNHSIIPSFTNDIISGINGDKITITDTNNVLNNFTVGKSEYHKLTVDGNTITIDLSETTQEETISLTRNKYDAKTLLVYQYPGSQSLAALRLHATENLSFKVKSEEKPVEIEKPKKEIVTVPSTSIEKKAIHFNTYKFQIQNESKFH